MLNRTVTVRTIPDSHSNRASTSKARDRNSARTAVRSNMESAGEGGRVEVLSPAGARVYGAVLNKALRDDGRPENSAAEQLETAEAVELARAEFRRQRSRTTDSGAGRTKALVEAGFSPDRAAWIVQREDELRLAAMQARFEAQRAGDMQAMFAANNRSGSALRDEIGDLEYEQYLNAYGRPTTVSVGTVIESSPGQLAGLQTGDAIVRYAGERVFNYSDINNLQLQGEPGESVVMDIVRDGTPMQIVLPRGPIGIQAGRFRGR